MKIPREIKQNLTNLVLQIVIGQVNDLEALALALDALALEARIQNGPQP